jgi:hypothetical protein
MWYDVSCASAKNLAVCRVPGVASQARRLSAGMDALEKENAALKAREGAHLAEIAALKARFHAE